MSGTTNLDLVRSICAGWERGEYGWVEWAHPEIDYVIPDGPAPGEWKGVDGMAVGWRDFLGAWEDAAITVDEVHEVDHERVLVLFQRRGRGRTSGVDLAGMRSRGANLFTIREGKVVRLVLYFEEATALADAGLERPGPGGE